MALLYPPGELDPRHSFAYWQDVVCSTYGPSHSKKLTDTPFDGVLDVRRVGSIAYTHIQSMPIEYEGSGTEAAADYFFLCLSLCNEAFVSQGRRQSRQAAGDLVLYDGARPYTCRFPKGDNQTVLAIPRPLLLMHFPQAEQFLSLTLSGGSVVGSLARTMMMELWKSPNLELAVEEKLNGSFLDILSTAFHSEFHHASAETISLQSQKLQRIKQYLLTHLDATELTIASIASDNHLSPRTLNRLFASEGTTAMHWLWQQRLMACHDALLTGRYARVSDVAFKFGFSNLSHFSRAFKSTYGITPQQLLSLSR